MINEDDIIRYFVVVVVVDVLLLTLVRVVAVLDCMCKGFCNHHCALHRINNGPWSDGFRW